MTVADYGFPPWPSASAMKTFGGITGVIRYVTAGSASKHLTKAEHDDLVGQGFTVRVVWEQAERTLASRIDGAAAARAALADAHEIGVPTDVVWWAADWDVQAGEWPVLRDNLRDIAGVLGVAGTGLYSSYDAIAWAVRDGVAGRFWQSMSTGYSGGRNARAHPAAHLWQRKQVTIGGAKVDLSDILKPDWAGGNNDMAKTDEWFDELRSTLEWCNRRLEALGRNYQPMAGAKPQQGEAMWAVGQLRKVDQVLAGVSALTAAVQGLAAATGGLSDADRQAIADATKAVTDLNSRLASP